VGSGREVGEGGISGYFVLLLRDVTANPNEKSPDFFLDAKNCYLSTLMPYAETTALEFPEAGTFEYTVQSNDGTVKTKGKIIVAGD
jgi:hypothetical protein